MRTWAIVALCAAVAMASLRQASSSAEPQGLSQRPSSEPKTAATLSPPLLRLTKGRFTAHLLPESHIGSPLEFGPHFHSVVLPVARRSRTLVYEGMNGDTFPGSPYWGRTCLDRIQEASSLGAQLTSRIVANHRYSQWADLRRAFSETSDAFAVEQFTAFIQARGLMINFLELHSRIHALLERELAMAHSNQPKVTAQEYLPGYGAHERISKLVPQLELESIETIEDQAWALCKLTAEQQRDALASAIELFDATEGRSLRLRPGARLQKVEMSFAALRAQLREEAGSGHRSALTTSTPTTALASPVVDPRPTANDRGQVLDRLRLGLRNERWAERMDGHAAANRKGLMYVLGSDHLLDFDHSAGLLTLLRQRGFRVEVVR